MLQRIHSLLGVYCVLYSPKSSFNIAVNLIRRDEIRSDNLLKTGKMIFFTFKEDIYAYVVSYYTFW